MTNNPIKNASGGVNLYNCTIKNDSEVSIKAKDTYALFSGNSTPEYTHSAEISVFVHQKTCTKILIEALFTVA